MYLAVGFIIISVVSTTFIVVSYTSILLIWPKKHVPSRKLQKPGNLEKGSQKFKYWHISMPLLCR